MTPAERVKQLARQCGFDLARITSAEPLELERARYLRWIGTGRQGEMRWITPEWAERATDPREVLGEVRSVVCVGLSYWAGKRPTALGHGKIARYAWGSDYHQAIGARLGDLAQELQQDFGGEHRWYVDTGPLMDKALAVRAGLGWYGKNTNLLTERFGSFVLLGEIITSLELDPDPQLQQDCGSCRLCLVACPTGALGPEYSIDSRKCISYLTIEHRGPIDRALRPLIGDWVFGCDICQDVCPPTMETHLRTRQERRTWAQQVRRQIAATNDRIAGEPAGLEHDDGGSPVAADSMASRDAHPLFQRGIHASVDLLWLLGLDHEQYVEAFRGTALKRAKVWMLRRNAAVALGNVGNSDHMRHLCKALSDDEHPVVRGHAAWALSRLADRHKKAAPSVIQEAVRALHSALETESDAGVRAEIGAALEDLASD
jgi:epoxyqueuosine reductase